MKASYNWLKEFVHFHLTPEELAEKLSLAGLEVEEIIEKGFSLDHVVIGKVITSEKHPNADKLKVCTVDVGTDTLQIVCGAPNVAPDQKVPVAVSGAVLPGGFKIKKAKLRGVESNGMICAQDELGISDDHSGIWVLPEDAPVGVELKDYLNQEKDYVYDLSITPNRPDCLSHYGIAREIAALTGGDIQLPEFSVTEGNESIDSLTKITIASPEGCPRYAARVIRNVKIGPSPVWLRNKLEAVGIRSINNVVDVTNFVLMELGHPLHAFDYDTLANHEIVVRFSKPGETFITLDGKEHKLPENAVMICDGEKPVALGGIMGGENSEVTNDTVNILLESAYFNPVFINRTAKTLNISTDASHRFERGADPNGVITALDRAAELIREVAGGEIAKGIIDVYPNPIEKKSVDLNLDYINRLIGVDFNEEQISSLLAPLGIDVKDGKAVIPTYRPDIERNADIAEEVSRLFGFDNIPAREVTEIPYGTIPNRFDEFLDEVKIYFANNGFYEIITNTMVKKEFHEKIIGEEALPIMNPVSQDFSVVRRYLTPSLLEVVKNNLNRQNYDLRLFEINRIFIPTGKDKTLPDEEMHLALAFTGNRYPAHWSVKNEPVDFFDAKGVVESLFTYFSLDNFQFIYYDNFVNKDENLAIKLNDEIVGFIAKVKSEILNEYDIEQSVYVVELNIAKVFEHRKIGKKYQELPKFPRTERDVAFVLDTGIRVSDIIEFIKKHGGKHLTDVTVFDRYVGKNLEKGKQSLAFRMVFQSAERTLTDDEVNKVFYDVINKIETKFNAKLRQ